ncbi:MAG: hypothetical protein Kow00114_32060 [Kiloniellaceae bacterium]
MRRNALLAAILAAIALLTFTRDAYAYLDPGTASMFLQGIIGGLAAALAVGAVYWQRVKSLFARMLGRGANGQPTAARREDK